MTGTQPRPLSSRAVDILGGLADDVWRMAESLKKTGVPVCADRTKRLCDDLHAARIEAKALADLWHNQERLASGDCGKAPVRAEAIKLGEPLP